MADAQELKRKEAVERLLHSAGAEELRRLNSARKGFEAELARLTAEIDGRASALDVDGVEALLLRREALSRVIAAARRLEDAEVQRLSDPARRARPLAAVEAEAEYARQRLSNISVVRSIDARLRSRPVFIGHDPDKEWKDAQDAELRAERERLVKLFGYTQAELYSFDEQRALGMPPEKRRRA